MYRILFLKILDSNLYNALKRSLLRIVFLKNDVIIVFGSVRREIFIAYLTQSGAAKLTSSPIRTRYPLY